MAAVNFDSRTLSVDGKRIWLVSGSIHFQRTPRAEWADRIHAAKHAGLNTIETPIFWNLIETRPGSYDFKANNDIRHFVQLIADAGMYCVLRVGPYVGEGWDLGGLPAWSLNIPNLELRKPNQPYLESVGKYFNALAKQVKDLQASTTRGAPIVMIQNEAHWNCGDELAAKGYLGELGRYLREAGFTVPKINSNNLWQGAEGDIDGWSGQGDMFGIMRQLTAVRPDQPEIVIDYGPKSRPVFAQPKPEELDGLAYQRQLAEITCAGGQFNLSNFASGTSHGFYAGKSPIGEFNAYAPTQDTNAMLDEHGRTTSVHHPVRRLTMFASSFARVLAHTEHENPPIVIDPASDPSMINGHIITHMRGTQGSVVFIFSPLKAKGGTLNLLLSDGASLQVRLGHQRVHWCMFDVNLSSQHTLDYTSLNTLTATENALVVFGAANAIGEVSINGTPMEVEVPKGRKPLVIDHEGMTLIVVCDEMADETYIHDEHVYVGVGGITPEGELIPSPNGKTHTHIDPKGVAKTHNTKFVEGYAEEKLPKVSIGAWERALPEEHIDGLSPRYAQIPGPADLSELGTPYGYGWYKVAIKNSANKKLKVMAPESSDRVTVFLDGEYVGVFGEGPGAEDVLSLPTKKGEQQLVMLADNMGRVDSGSDMTGNKGVYGHIIEQVSFKVAKPKIENGDPIEILGYRSPVFGLQMGDSTHPGRITWSFKHLKKSSIVVDIPPVPVRMMVILNDEPIRLFDANHRQRLVLDDETTKRGVNDLQIAFENNVISHDGVEFVENMLKLINEQCHFYEASNAISDKCEWSFAKWETPAEIDFDSVNKSKMTSTKAPAWWRSSFDSPSVKVATSLDLAGMTKGQVYVNGHALGRYFVTTNDGKTVEPSLPLAIPSSLLHTDKENDLTIFDEHGASPAKVKVIVERL
jgi:beta-galactosidase